MRVLHVITGLENGGAEAVLYRLATGSIGSTRHEVVSLTSDGFYGSYLSQAGIQVHVLRMPRGRVTFTALARLYRLIRVAAPDVVQTWMYHADLLGGIVARLAGRRPVWSIHHSDLDPRRTARSTRWVARFCAWASYFLPAKIICCSEKAAAVHLALGYRANKIVVVPNGIDVRTFHPDSSARTRLRHEWGISDDEVALGMVARWDPQKDHANLVAAMAYLGSRLQRSWHCVLVGTGMDDSNRELLNLLAAHGMRDRFRLAGARNDIPAVMNALDLHVLSSSGEAFGNVTVEAMACGVPAVVTSVGAGDAIVGNTGWVVPPSDPEALARAILQAIDAMKIHGSWGERKAACRDRVIKHYGLSQMIDAYHRVWVSAAV